MNASQIHLALTHMPVILSFVGLVMLIISLIKKNDILTKTSLYIFFAAGIFVLPVYFTGEGAEEVVENLPGVSESLIEKHEQFANISLAIISICAILSVVALFVYKYLHAARIIKYAVLVFAVGSAMAMAQTAHLGGQIRHSEIRTAFASTTISDQNDGNAKEKSNTEKNGSKDED